MLIRRHVLGLAIRDLLVARPVDYHTMSSTLKSRLAAIAVVLVVIPIGLFARSQRAGADPSSLGGFLATYTGDTLWPVMFYFLGRFCSPRAKLFSIAAFTLILTLGIELLQLWKTPTLQWLRAQPITGFLLGNTFLVSDMVCCVTSDKTLTTIKCCRRLRV